LEKYKEVNLPPLSNLGLNGGDDANLQAFKIMNDNSPQKVFSNTMMNIVLVSAIIIVGFGLIVAMVYYS
jgi:hypothetical protein